MQEDLISVIIPIYNAAEYLDYCLFSVCFQTYKNIEIILINDGSTDTSEKICVDWCSRDSRIVYFAQTNQGAGIARNRGIELANGNYVFFVDADDWIEKDCLKEMHKAIIDNAADICSSDHYLFDEVTKVTTKVSSPLNNERFDIMNYKITSFSWKLIKKEIFVNYNIQQPGGVLEDFAIYPIVLLVAKKKCYVDKPFYYYRKNTQVSTMDNLNYVFKYPAAMLVMISESKRLKLWPENKALLKDIAQYHMRETLNNLKKRNCREIYNKADKLYNDFLKEYFNVHNYDCYIVGSYNLSRIVAYANVDYDLLWKDLKFYFGNASLISLMADPCNKDIDIKHENIFRKSVLKKELYKEFLQQELEHSDNKNDDYLLIDLLEECNGLVYIANTIITENEMYYESNLKEYAEKTIIGLSQQAFELWKPSCEKFIWQAKKRFRSNHIIIMEIYLTETIKKNDEKEYNWNQDIKTYNNKLKEYYDYLKKMLPEAKIITVPTELNYTDGASKYGGAPTYLNINAHQEMGRRVRAYLDELNMEGGKNAISHNNSSDL